MPSDPAEQARGCAGRSWSGTAPGSRRWRPTRPITRPTSAGVGTPSSRQAPAVGRAQAEQAADRRRLPRPVRARGTRRPRPRGPRGRARPRPPAVRRRRRRYSLRSPSISITGVMAASIRRAPSRDRYGSATVRTFRCDRPARWRTTCRGRWRGGRRRRQGSWSRCSARPASSATAPWSPSTPARPPRCSATWPSPARPQRRETLAALLWPDADDTRARSALRRTLSVIRKELGDLGPTHHPGRGGARRRRRRRRSTSGRSSPAPASDDVEEVARAAALWRGDLLAGFSLRDSPDFDDWQAREAERLRRVMSVGLRSPRRRLRGGRRARRGRRPRRAMAGPRPAARAGPPRADAAARAARRSRRGRAPVPAVRPHRRRGARGGAARGDDGALRGHQRRGAWAAAGGRRREPPSDAVVGRYPLTGRDDEVDRLLAAIGPGSRRRGRGRAGRGQDPPRRGGRSPARAGRPSTARCYDNDGDVPYGPLVELLRLAAADPAAAAGAGDAPAVGRGRGGPAGARARRRPTPTRAGRGTRRRGPVPRRHRPRGGGGRERAAGPARRRRRPVGRRRHPAGARPPRCTAAATTGRA